MSGGDLMARALMLRSRREGQDWARRDGLVQAAVHALAGNSEEAAPAAGVTMTTATAADTKLSRLYPVATAAGVMRFGGGRPMLNATRTQMAFPVASIAPATSGNLGTAYGGTGDRQAWGWDVTVATDADRVQFATTALTNPFYGYRLIVDGHAVNSDPTPWSINGTNYVALDFAGIRHPRTIQLQVGGQVTLRGIAVGPGAVVWSPAPLPGNIVVLATGDSYSEGIGAAAIINAWPKRLGRLMGWSDVRQVAVGGTGYLNAGDGRSTIRDQIARWLAVNDDIDSFEVDVVTVAAGYNDHSYGLSALQSEILGDLTAIRALLPNAWIVVFGDSTGARGPDAATLAVETTIAAAHAVWGDANSLWVPISTAPSPWFFGTGRVGAATGTGNADMTIASDGIHPSDTGHRLFAGRAAEAIRAALLQG